MSDREALGALLDADRWIDRVVFQRAHLPESDQLAALESVLRQQAAALRDEEAAAAAVRSAYEEAATRADQLQRRRRELEVALAVSTVGRDLAAMQHELESIVAQRERVDDEALARLVELEEREAAIDGLRTDARANVDRRESLRAAVSELGATLDDEIAELRVARTACAASVSASVLARYERAMARAGTSGAARVVEGRCDGCRIALAPLDADRVKALADDEFMECPSCARLLLR